MLEELKEDNEREEARRAELVAWVMDKVDAWEQYRDDNYKSKWEEYYRLWRGIWVSQDKTRDSERSRLIVPALQQAIESSTAELEEATFGKGIWFDIVDDHGDPEREDMAFLRKQLYEDMERAKVPGAISESFLNGGLYGNGIGKIVVEKVTRRRPASRAGGPGEVVGGVEEYEEIEVSVEPVAPSDFCIDPSAKTIDDGLGCAHTLLRPMHSIISKQKDGTYYDVDITSYSNTMDVSLMGEKRPVSDTDSVLITEYYGLVPKRLLEATDEEIVSLFDEDGNDDLDDVEMVEALITIANKEELLKAVENPYMMKDRPIVAYQHDRVPGRFWGRGIAEKGYNPQKALDAELRARIDAMALAAHPMLAMDASRLPRGFKPVVGPGKTLMTVGPPSQSLMPFQFSQIGPATFTESGELERMVQMGTGAMDSAAPIGVSPRNATASGMSMMQSGAIKRSKRTLKNIELYFLRPMIEKIAWRYMQFSPERYPVKDYKFMPKTTLGIMAREYEQQQLTNLLAIVSPEKTAFNIILKGIFDNSSLENRDELIKAIEADNQPRQPSPEEQMQMQIQMELAKTALAKEKATVQEIGAKTKATMTKAQADAARVKTDAIRAQGEMARAQNEDTRLQLDAAILPAEYEQTMADAELSASKAEAEELKAKLAIIETQMKVMEHQVAKAQAATKTAALMPPQQSSDSIMMSRKVQALEAQLKALMEEKNKPIRIERDKDGRIVSVDGKAPIRNDQGLIEEL